MELKHTAGFVLGVYAHTPHLIAQRWPGLCQPQAAAGSCPASAGSPPHTLHLLQRLLSYGRCAAAQWLMFRQAVRQPAHMLEHGLSRGEQTTALPPSV